MTFLVLAALLASIAFSFFSARRGPLGVIATGFLQDMARKVVPGEPVWLQGLVWVALALYLLRQQLEGGEPLRLAQRLFGRRVRTWGAAFLVVVILQSMMSFVRTGSGLVPLIGTLAYVGPVLAVAGAAAFLRRERRLELLMGFYVVLALVNAIGIILSFRGVEMSLLDTVGGVFIVFQEDGTSLRLIPGFLRSAEVSSWHCATAAILCVTLGRSLVGRRRGLKIAAFTAVVPLMGALVLTGRRKMLAAVLIAVVAQVVIEMLRTRGGWRVALGFGAVLLILAISSGLGFTRDVPAGMEGYVERSRTLRTDWADRVQMTFDSLFWTAYSAGFLGVGTGMTSQGSQHYVEVDELVLGASETGPSKVMTELGVPGLFILTMIVVNLLVQTRRNIDREAKKGAALTWETGLFAYLLANAAVFSVAHQVFGDPFVLMMLGLLTGVMLVRLDHRRRSDVALRQPAALQANLAFGR